MNFNELKALDHQYTLQTYGRFDLGLDHGEGATLFDLDGRAYIDFASGIGVNSVGYANPKWIDAVVTQAGKLAHCSNLYYSEPYAKLSQVLCRRTGMAGAFYANGGGEANEGLIKLARKYSFDKYGKGRGTIITLKDSFHGRTVTTLAATGQDGFHNYFFPFTDGFRYAQPNDMDSVAEVAGHDVCAVMLELVQGEGGVNPMEREFVHELAVLCAERDWLLLVDEVQTGVGRTGTMFSFQQYGILPDAISFAKGIAGGLPMSGILVSEKCKQVLGPGQHATTFGGNPIAASAALAVQEILDDDTLNQVEEKGAYLRNAILDLRSPFIMGVRGLGLMLGVELQGERTNREIAALLLEHGLLTLTAGKNVLRLLPPLTISQEELDKGLEIMKDLLA